MENFDITKEYDKIDTSAARWLKWNRDAHKQEIGIDKINKTDACRWLFNTFYNYSILTNSIYYTHNLIAFLYYYFFKKHKNIRFSLGRRKDVFWIEAPQFISEINSLSNTPCITEKIYNYYNRR